MALPSDYSELLSVYRDAQTAMQKLIQNHAQLESQLNENGMVEEELKRLSETDAVYKLCGAILIAQDKAEALSTIESRLKFIQTEL
jgi:prefoldin beta subunit